MTLLSILLIGLAAAFRAKATPVRSAREAVGDGGPTGNGGSTGNGAPPDPPREPPPPEALPPRRVGRRRRRIGRILIVAGVLLVAYSAAVIFWRDPATDLYARWKQHQLAAELDDEFAAYAAAADNAPVVEEADPAATPRQIAVQSRERVEAAANRLNERLKMGHALGRIKIPRLGVDAVFVQGTRWGPDLSQGPGHYPQSSLPGVGRTAAIAAHRTTFGAWFRHIDSLRAGNTVVLQLPYATFHYRVFGHKIVDNGDWSVIRDRGFDTLVLSACHPLYSASHRWIVFAALERVEPVKGTPYLVNRQNEVRPVGT